MPQPSPTLTKALKYLAANNINSEANAMTAVEMIKNSGAAGTGFHGLSAAQISGSLAAHMRIMKPKRLRRSVRQESVTGEYQYWLSTSLSRTTAKSKPKKRTRKSSCGKTVGIYFTQENGEDILLTFEEARALYSKMKIIFGD